MKDLSLADKYAIGAAIALLVLVFINNPIVMLVVAVLGLGAGMVVVRAGETKRVVYVAALAFALMLGLALFTLLR